MKTITDRLMSLDPTFELHNEGEWSGTKLPYYAFNSGGVECEVGEFLYAFLRMTKPEYVLETGTHKAVGASYMGLALLDNGLGHLDTIEFIPEIHAEAVARIARIGLDQAVTCHLMDAKDFQPKHVYDFVLLDTEPQTRFREFIQLYRFVRPGGYIFIHDLHRHMQQVDNEEHGFGWPFGKIPGAITQGLFQGEFRLFHFGTPRGLTGFYKASEEDYDYRKG